MSVVFDESILDNLSDDPVNAGKEICDHFFSFLQKVRGSRRPLDDYYEDFLKAYSLLGTFQKSVGAEVQEPSLSGDFSTNVEIIVKAF